MSVTITIGHARFIWPQTWQSRRYGQECDVTCSCGWADRTYADRATTVAFGHRQNAHDNVGTITGHLPH